MTEHGADPGGDVVIEHQREQVHPQIDDGGWEMEVDLETQTVSLGNGKSRQFDIDPFVKHCLLNGLDDIGLTMQHEPEITAYEAGRPAYKPSLAATT